jgi:hypothetical protein
MRMASARVFILVTALFAILSSALAQELDQNLQVIGVDAGADQSVVAGSIGTVQLCGAITNGYTSEFPLVILWNEVPSDNTVYTELEGFIDAPMATTTYRLVVWNIFTGEWGEDTMTVATGDSTAPVIQLRGFSPDFIAAGVAYNDLGVDVSDDTDPSPDLEVTGSVNSSVVGVYELVYTATDASGNSSSISRMVCVMYDWTGLLAPIDPSGNGIYKLGRTIPLKFQLLGPYAGKTDLLATVSMAKLTDGIAGTEVISISTSAVDVGNIFRYTGGQYVYNLGTGLGSGLSQGTWEIRVNLGDGAIHRTIVSLKK